jgi:hypothetical protein
MLGRDYQLQLFYLPLQGLYDRVPSQSRWFGLFDNTHRAPEHVLRPPAVGQRNRDIAWCWRVGIGRTSTEPSLNSMSRFVWSVSRRYCSSVQRPCSGSRSISKPSASQTNFSPGVRILEAILSPPGQKRFTPLKRMGIHAALCQTSMTQIMMPGNPFHHARRGDLPLCKGARKAFG